MTKKRILITAASASVGVVLAIICSVITSPRRNLERFLGEVSKVELGKTRQEDLRTVVARAHISNSSFSCQQQKCGLGWRGENKFLYKFRLAPRTIVDASVGFTDGVASEILIVLAIASYDNKRAMHDDKGVTVRQSMDVPSDCNPHYLLSVKQRGTGERYWATVAMDSCVSTEDRAKALAINGACLTKIGGCKRVEEMIPQVFNPSTTLNSSKCGFFGGRQQCQSSIIPT